MRGWFRARLPSNDANRSSKYRTSRSACAVCAWYCILAAHRRAPALDLAHALLGLCGRERAGVLQKFSHRGWICKTQEGEICAQYLVAGISPQIWQFSVRDPAVGAQLEKAVGHRVQLHYTEHPGMPTACFADTRYFVDRVTVTDNAPGTVAPASPGAAPQRSGCRQPGLRRRPAHRLQPNRAGPTLKRTPARARDLLGDADRRAQRQQSVLAAHRRRAARRRRRPGRPRSPL